MGKICLISCVANTALWLENTHFCQVDYTKGRSYGLDFQNILLNLHVWDAHTRALQVFTWSSRGDAVGPVNKSLIHTRGHLFPVKSLNLFDLRENRRKCVFASCFRKLTYFIATLLKLSHLATIANGSGSPVVFLDLTSNRHRDVHFSNSTMQ